MGIDETVKEICDKKPKLRGIVLGVRFSDDEREQIRAKADEIGDGATSCDVIRGALISTGIIKGGE